MVKVELDSVIGFGGSVRGAFSMHPSGKMVYPLGANVVISSPDSTRADRFLEGHTDKVCVVEISPSGRYIASGQITHMGFQADIIVWDWETSTIVHRLTLHKVKVQALSFSHDERYLASVGGQDDNQLVIWDVASGRPLCGGQASADVTLALRFFNRSNDRLVSAGHNVLRVWDVDFVNRKILPTDVALGQLKRVNNVILVDDDDKRAFVGTASGDVLCIQLTGPKNFKYLGPKKKIPQGVLSLGHGGPDEKGLPQLILGGGAGSVLLLSKADLSIKNELQVQGGARWVFSFASEYWVGTTESCVYSINPKTYRERMRQTGHFERINDVCFAAHYSDLFATSSGSDIRVWNRKEGSELLKVHVPNLECNCVAFTSDGSTVVSGWSDGRVRAFGPQSGKLVYTINDAHKIPHSQKRVSGTHLGVTAVAVTHDNRRLITGGSDGQVRVWKVGTQSTALDLSLKEHKSTVNFISVRDDDAECVTASDDGSCIVWDLKRGIRRNIIYAQTYFKASLFFVDYSQILTTGSDKKISFWDAYDCSVIRELEGSPTAEIHALDISPDGKFFATGSQDKTLKLWNYDEGTQICSGTAHSGNITRVTFSPDQKYIVSVGDEAGIFIWKLVE